MPVVYLAITPLGLQNAIQAAKLIGATVWCGADAVSEEEFRNLGEIGLTRFNYPLNGESSDVIEGAVNTIEEHHPGATVWVESPNPK